MGYIDSNLMQGETVMYRSKLHKVLFFWYSVFSIGFILLGLWIIFKSDYNHQFGVLSYTLAALNMLPPYIQYTASEFAVTNKRVIVKLGFISRQTVETLLQRIEAVGVDQTILGRICNYGTITIKGTGGTQEIFQNIVDPLGFRRAVQEQTDNKEKTNPT
jgi:uncharacterized membrane protein YdbT with pleckstrin-like domain